MGNICIIPARGGSKRIPRKNVKSFLGKPIIAYSIEAAISSGLFDTVMVSTDDVEIAEIARQYGAEIPFMRSTKNASDHATTFAVISEVIDEYKKRSTSFEYACCIYSCAPFVTKEKLIESYSALQEGSFDSVFPVMPFGFPIQRALKLNKQGRISFFNPEFALTRSQDLDPSFHDAGQFYWFRVEKCMNYGAIITDNSGAIELSELEGQDIDTETDWQLAELKYHLRSKNIDETV